MVSIRQPLKSYKILENDVLRLESFDIERDCASLLEETKDNHELFKYIQIHSFSTVDEFKEFHRVAIDEDDGRILYAIYDKLKYPGEMAGIIGLTGTSYSDAQTEIAFVIIFEKFQRSHVNTNAAGLLLLHCLDPPDEDGSGGLGLRRVQWVAHLDNKKSISAAERLGFVLEGVLRWYRVLPVGKLGLSADPVGGEKYPEYKRPGRHNAVLSICWDEWLMEGKREHLLEKMKPRA